jgi:hypothetical protein
MVLPPHFSVSPPNVCTRAVQGCRRYACTRRRSSIPTASRPLPTFSGGGSWAGPFLNTAHRRIPTEGVRFRASPSCFRSPPLVPGLFWFRARVILLPDGPTRPIPRLPVRGKVPTFPHPEPPLRLVSLAGSTGSGLAIGNSRSTVGAGSSRGTGRCPVLFPGNPGGRLAAGSPRERDAASEVWNTGMVE